MYQNKQAKLIQKWFKQFCLNRIQNKQIGETFKSHSLFKDEWIFQPQLSEYSKELAVKHRKSTNSIGLKIYESMTEKMKQNNEWRAIQRRLKEQDMMREWTFTPDIHTVSSFEHNKSDNAHQTDKSLLNDKSTERWRNKYELKNKSYVENSSKQTTGSRHITKSSGKASPTLRYTKFKDHHKKSIDSNVKRMREAIKDKEIVQIMKERGL